MTYLPPGAIPQAPIMDTECHNIAVSFLNKVPEASPVPHCMICLWQI